MSENRLTNDASASTKGTVYHLYTTVLKCHEMGEGQTVYVERFGDVTKSGDEQVEIKHYNDTLTDSHLNFWKTLSNWMEPGFDETKYRSLILQTTQDFGSRASLRSWNDSRVSERIAMLKRIHSASNGRKRTKTAKKKKMTDAVTASAFYQRKILDPSKTAKLERVVARLVIAANSPALQPLYEQLKHQVCKGVLVGKQEDFLNTLVGFVTSPAVISANTWEITYDQYTQKFRELTAMYCHETRQFPTKFDDTINGPSTDAVVDCRYRAFVKKIEDIQHHEVISDAINHYLAASHMVLEELRSYEVPDDVPRRYSNHLRDVFSPRYRKALRNVRDVLNDSKNFYDETVSEPPPQLHTFTDTPIAFRNGMLHMLLDDNDEMKWRLE